MSGLEAPSFLQRGRRVLGPIAEMALVRVGGRLLGESCRHCGTRATRGPGLPVESPGFDCAFGGGASSRLDWRRADELRTRLGRVLADPGRRPATSGPTGDGTLPSLSQRPVDRRATNLQGPGDLRSPHALNLHLAHLGRVNRRGPTLLQPPSNVDDSRPCLVTLRCRALSRPAADGANPRTVNVVGTCGM
jgi:hypothetical protein